MPALTYVIATDLSPASRKGAGVAASIALWSGAQLDFFCGVPRDAANDMDALLDSVRTEVDDLARRHAKDGLATACHVAVVRDVAKEILKHAARREATMVVVSPQGATGWKRLVLGSITERVMRLGPPLLLLARGPRIGKTPHIVLAVDRTGGSSRALRKGIDVAAQIGASLTVLHVLPPPGPLLALREGLDVKSSFRQAKARIRKAKVEFDAWVDALPRRGVALTTRVVEGEAPAAILAEAKQSQAALIVLGTHGKSRAQEFFVGSVARAVATAAPVSVLLVHARPPRHAGRKKGRKT